VRYRAHAYTPDGGLAVLRGNIAPDGAIVKTAGVEEELWTFTGPAKVFESQEAAVDGILGKHVQPGDDASQHGHGEDQEHCAEDPACVAAEPTRQEGGKDRRRGQRGEHDPEYQPGTTFRFHSARR
jgi:hypothetical protein